MLSLRFHLLPAAVPTQWELYTSENRLPLKLTLGEKVMEWHYCRNYDEQHSMLEFYFDRATQRLQEFTIVMLTGPVEGARQEPFCYDPHTYYRCELVGTEGRLRDTVPLRIQQSADQLVFCFREANQDLSYYQVGRGFVLGVTPGGSLATVALTQLTPEALQTILGDVANGGRL